MKQDDAKSQALKQFLYSQKGLERLMMLLREKWRSYGKTAGKVWLEDPTDEEIREIEQLLGKTQRRQGKLGIMAKDFEAAIDEVTYGQLKLKEILEIYFDEELVSKKDEEAIVLGEKEKIAAHLNKEADGRWPDGSFAYVWMNTLTPAKLWKHMESFNGEEEMIQVILQIGDALEILSSLKDGRGIRLSELSKEVTGDPDKLDHDTTVGKLFLTALSVLPEEDNYGDRSTSAPYRLSYEEMLDVYIRAGIRPDDISSYVIFYGLHLEDEEGRVDAYEDILKRKEPVMVSLYNLQKIIRAMPNGKAVYVIENQSVFKKLITLCPEASLICTSNTLRTAALMLLDLLCKEDIAIYYSGDVDPEGLTMADRVYRRSRGKVSIWHMSPEDYEKSRGEGFLSEVRLSELSFVRSDCLKETARMIRANGNTADQMKLIEVLKEELLVREKN